MDFRKEFLKVFSIFKYLNLNYVKPDLHRPFCHCPYNVIPSPEG